ncbi:MAG: dolichyl-phosphate beta-glucosyltransferase [Patescibacteria group bacterium]
MIDYSIVISAYNEESRITKTLTQTLSFMNQFAPAFEIVVVDDGSKDKTAEVVEEYAKDHPEIKLVKNVHKGKAAGIRTGVLKSSGKMVLMMDADMATPLEELKRLATWINDNDFDIAIASREGIGAERQDEPLYRHIMGRVFNLLVKTVIGLDFQDTQCGFKLFKGDVARKVFSHLIVYGDNLPQIDRPFFGAFDVEVLYCARQMGYKIKDIPVKWNYVPTTRLNILANSYKMARDVLRIKILGLKGAYALPKREVAYI